MNGIAGREVRKVWLSLVGNEHFIEKSLGRSSNL